MRIKVSARLPGCGELIQRVAKGVVCPGSSGPDMVSRSYVTVMAFGAVVDGQIGAGVASLGGVEFGEERGLLGRCGRSAGGATGRRHLRCCRRSSGWNG